jgi:hypothetical protein
MGVEAGRQALTAGGHATANWSGPRRREKEAAITKMSPSFQAIDVWDFGTFDQEANADLIRDSFGEGSATMIDFDNIDDWAPKLTASLKGHVPHIVEQRLVAAAPRYIEDARDLLFKLSNREAIIDAALVWIRSTTVLGYHGTRLTEGEIASVQTVGLLPLKAQARRDRLTRALSPHPRWSEVANGLDAAIKAHGLGNCSGWREGQVHLTLSRAGLVNGFNHYLTHGSEFDQHVAYALLKTEGERLLGLDGKPRVIQIAVPGDLALDASHPHFGIDDLRAKGDVPNLVRSFLDAWSYRLAHPKFQARALKVDSGMVFRSTVPATWVVNIETLPD